MAQCGLGLRLMSVRVARSHVANDLGAFFQVSANDEISSRRAGPVALLIAMIPAVEAGDHARSAVAAWRLGVDQGLHLVAPLLALIGAAEAAQIVQRAEDFGEALEAAVEGRGHALGACRAACRKERDRSQQQSTS